MMNRLAAAALLAGLISPALAQTALLPYTYPFTVGTGSTAVAAVNPARKRIEFVNPNATTLVAVCPTISRTGTPPTPITCTVNGPGSVTLLPYQSYRVDGVGGNPQVNTAWNAIASGAGSSLTVFEWE